MEVMIARMRLGDQVRRRIRPRRYVRLPTCSLFLSHPEQRSTSRSSSSGKHTGGSKDKSRNVPFRPPGAVYECTVYPAALKLIHSSQKSSNHGSPRTPSRTRNTTPSLSCRSCSTSSSSFSSIYIFYWSPFRSSFLHSRSVRPPPPLSVALLNCDEYRRVYRDIHRTSRVRPLCDDGKGGL